MYYHPETTFVLAAEVRSRLIAEAEHARTLTAARQARRARRARRRQRGHTALIGHRQNGEN